MPAKQGLRNATHVGQIEKRDKRGRAIATKEKEHCLPTAENRISSLRSFSSTLIRLKVEVEVKVRERETVRARARARARMRRRENMKGTSTSASGGNAALSSKSSRSPHLG